MPAEKQKRRPFTVAERDAPESALGERRADRARRGDRVARQPERARQDARPAAGQEAERHRAVRAVQRLVVGAVAGEDDDRVGVAAAAAAASSVAWPGACVNSVSSSTCSRRTRSTAVIRSPGHLRRVRIDDQHRPLHARRACHANRLDRRRARGRARRRRASGSRTTRSAALGVPAHVTILFPFAPPGAVDESAVAEPVASLPAFEFELASVEHFDDDVTYLRRARRSRSPP